MGSTYCLGKNIFKCCEWIVSPLLLLHFVTLIVVLLNKPFKTSFLYLLCREKQNIDLFIVQFVISISIFCNIMPKTIIFANLTQKIVNIGNGKTIFEHSVNRFRNCRQIFCTTSAYVAEFSTDLLSGLILKYE